MRSFAFAWRRLVRQPGRSVLAILGVAAVGALLFDMLLLSRGLVVSLADQLDRVGFDVRVTTGSGLSVSGDRIEHASGVVDAVSRLPEVEAVVSMRIGAGWVLWPQLRVPLTIVGATPGQHAGWQLVEGRGLDQATASFPPVVVSRSVLSATVRERTVTIEVGRREGRYVISLDLPSTDVGSGEPAGAAGSRVKGEIVLEAGQGRSLPPLTILGARGWTSGYTVGGAIWATGGRWGCAVARRRVRLPRP